MKTSLHFTFVHVADCTKSLMMCFTFSYGVDGALLAGVPSFTTKDTRMGCLQRNEGGHQTLLRCIPYFTQAQLKGIEDDLCGCYWLLKLCPADLKCHK